MILISIFLLALMVGHFVGDFPLQSDWMALNKSKTTIVGLEALTTHAAVYTGAVTLTIVATMAVTFWGDRELFKLLWEIGTKFWLITFATHWVTDFITSRVTSKLFFFQPAGASLWHYVDGKRHWFFVMIGFDQLIHQIMLVVSFIYVCLSVI